VTEVRRGPSTRRPNEGGVVEGVRAGSLAERAGIRAGERVTAIDGRRLRDAVDFQYYAAEDVIELEVAGEPARGRSATRTVTIEKAPDADLGIEFEDAAFDGVRTCNNSCFFCFLKGNPKGMRKTLYVKDDDYRLSFFHGNFVTLTNLSEEDWERIGEQRLSPLNVSVHATDLELRRYLLGNRTAPDVVAQLRRLGAMGIETNTQVVVCPGVNDGAALERTIGDLAALWPHVRNVSVVPVGATMVAEERIERQRHGEEIDACTAEHARAVIAQTAPYQRRFRRERGRTFVYLADEYYLAAGIEPPGGAHYDGFPQYENGIGMTRSLIDDWRRVRRRTAGTPAVRRMTIACGALIAPTLARLASELEEITGATARVRPIENTFFGPRVNVSGLLVGEEFARALADGDAGELVLLPRYALDYTGTRFLDDMTAEALQDHLRTPIRFAVTMSDVLQILREPLESPHGPSPGAAARTNGKAWVDYAATS
jgi:putative radical SAM enzyme (TIGR03279 family)